MARVNEIRRVISCSASRLICRSSSARRSASAAARFWEISTKVDRKIASTDATVARITKLGSNTGTPGSQPRLAAAHAATATAWT